MINKADLNMLMDAGCIPYVYAPKNGKLAVTESILEANNMLSGDEVSRARIRALMQIHEPELIQLSERLALEYPG